MGKFPTQDKISKVGDTFVLIQLLYRLGKFGDNFGLISHLVSQGKVGKVEI